MVDKLIEVSTASPVTQYTDTSTYNAAGDNAPFLNLEDRGSWFANYHQQLGLTYLAKITTSTAVAILSDYTLVFIDNVGVLTAVDTTTTIPVGSIVGITYPIESSGSMAYVKLTAPNVYDQYYYVIVTSNFLNIPIGTSAATSLFGASSWTTPTTGSRNYSNIQVGDYIYYDAESASTKLIAVPSTVDITSESDYANLLAPTDAPLNVFKLGKVIAKTNTEYVIHWGDASSYGTQVTGVTSHSALTDIAAETPADPNPDVPPGAWVMEHPEYVKRIIVVPAAMMIGSPTTGDLIEILGTSYTTDAGKYQISACSDDSVLAGVYITDYTSSLHYILVHGEWDSSAAGFSADINGLSGLTINNAGQDLWDAGDSSAGTATMGRPSYTGPAVTEKSNIRYLGMVVDANVCYLRPANGLNKILDYAYDVFRSNIAPDPIDSNLQIQDKWSEIKAESDYGTILSYTTSPQFYFSIAEPSIFNTAGTYLVKGSVIQVITPEGVLDGVYTISDTLIVAGYKRLYCTDLSYYVAAAFTTGTWIQLDYLKNVDIYKNMKKIPADASISVTPMFNQVLGDPSTSTSSQHWFALSESSYFNDLEWDVSNRTTDIVSGTAVYPYADKYQTNDVLNTNPNDTSPLDITAGNDIYQGAGANGSFRLGDRPWSACVAKSLTEIRCSELPPPAVVTLTPSAGVGTLTSETNYLYRISTLTIKGESQTSIEYTATLGVGENTVTIDWYNVNIAQASGGYGEYFTEPVIGYRIYRFDSGANYYTNMIDISVDPTADPTTMLTYVDLNGTDWQSTSTFYIPPVENTTITDDNRCLYLVSDDADNIWWHEEYVNTGIGLSSNLPSVGCMALVRDFAATGYLGMLFSYDGIEQYAGTGADTGLFLTKFYNVTIKRNNNWQYIPHWSATDLASTGFNWGDVTQTNWKMNMMLVGGLKLNLKGTGKFGMFSVVPPAGVSDWYKLKKSGTFMLGAPCGGKGQGVIGEPGASAQGWDSTYDGASTAYWAGLTEATAISNSSIIDYNLFDTMGITSYGNIGCSEFTAASASADGCLHKAYPHPGCTIQVNKRTSGAADGVGAITQIGTTDEYKYVATAGTAPNNPATQVVTEGKDNYIKGARIDIHYTSGGAKHLLGCLVTRCINTTDDELYFRYPGTITTGAFTGASWTMYTINDDIVNSPSILALNDKEVWIDISKKSAYRTYSMMLTVLDPEDGDSIEATIAQSNFNNGITSLKSFVVGTDIYRFLTEGSKVKIFVKPRIQSPANFIP
jgi:hypothetical protein